MPLLYPEKRFKGIVGKGCTIEEFSAYVAALNFGPWKPEFIVLHNTGNPYLDGWHQVSGEQRMKNLAHYYAGNGWSAGPHLFIADDRIWVFSPLTAPGVHSPSWNRVSMGVECVGNYDVEDFRKIEANVIAALAILHTKLGLDPATLRFHKDDPATTHRGCPGRHIDKAQVVAQVQERMAPVKVTANGAQVEAAAYLDNGRCMVALRPVAQALRLAVVKVGDGVAEIGTPHESHRLPISIKGDTGFVAATDLEQLGLEVKWLNSTKTVSISSR